MRICFADRINVLNVLEGKIRNRIYGEVRCVLEGLDMNIVVSITRNDFHFRGFYEFEKVRGNIDYAVNYILSDYTSAIVRHYIKEA